MISRAASFADVGWPPPFEGAILMNRKLTLLTLLFAVGVKLAAGTTYSILVNG